MLERCIRSDELALKAIRSESASEGHLQAPAFMKGRISWKRQDLVTAVKELVVLMIQPVMPKWERSVEIRGRALQGKANSVSEVPLTAMEDSQCRRRGN